MRKRRGMCWGKAKSMSAPQKFRLPLSFVFCMLKALMCHPMEKYLYMNLNILRHLVLQMRRTLLGSVIQTFVGNSVHSNLQAISELLKVLLFIFLIPLHLL